MRTTTLANIEQAAGAVGVKSSWLLKEAKAGRVPCIAVSKARFLFSIDALSKHLAERAGQKPAAAAEDREVPRAE